MSDTSSRHTSPQAPPLHQTFGPIPALALAFTTLLRSLSADDETARVPGLEWSAAEVGAHVLTVVRRYLAPTERAATRERLVDLNDEDIAALGMTTSQVADELDAVIARLAQVAPSVPLDTPRAFHLGLTVTVAAGWANLIGELLVHGDDIARATGRPWSVDGELVEGIWRDLMPAAAGWMRHDARTVREVYHVAFPFGLVVLAVEGGTVRIDADVDRDRAPDHVIDVSDPIEVTLQFPYRRRSIRDPRLALLASRFIDI